MGTRNKSGFTIVELLVVITIIGILMSLLLPAINSALKQAEKTQCMSNIRQITLAMLTYKTDWGYFPPGRWYDYHPSSGEPGKVLVASDPSIAGADKTVSRMLPRWQFILMDDLNVAPQDPFDATMRYPANQNLLMLAANTSGEVPMDTTAKIYRCPSLSGVALDLNRSHYGYNYQYLGNARRAWWDDTAGAVDGGSFYGDRTAATGAPYTNFPVTSGAIKSADRTIAFADSQGDRQNGHGHCSYLIDPPRARSRGGRDFDLYAAYMGGGIAAATPDWDSDGLRDCEFTTDIIYSQNVNPSGFCPVDFRHSRKASVSFCDGHVEAMALADVGYVFDSSLDLDGDGVADGGLVANHGSGSNKYWNGTGINPNP